MRFEFEADVRCADLSFSGDEILPYVIVKLLPGVCRVGSPLFPRDIYHFQNCYRVDFECLAEVGRLVLRDGFIDAENKYSHITVVRFPSP